MDKKLTLFLTVLLYVGVFIYFISFDIYSEFCQAFVLFALLLVLYDLYQEFTEAKNVH